MSDKKDQGEGQNSIQEMQFIEQNLQSLIYQKQAFQVELSETQSALKEVESSDEDVFKLAGQILIKTKKDKILEELKNKEKILNLRLKSLENQEAQLTDRIEKLRNSVVKDKKDE